MNEAQPVDSRTRLSRRRLLQGLGAFTAALTSPIWRPATAFGFDAYTPAAKRFIGVFSANGTVPSAFFPASTSADSPLTLGPILAPLEAHKSKLVVLKGVDMTSTIGANKPGGPHMKGPGAMLTGGSLLPGSFTGSGGPAGYADRISVDQFIADRIGSSTQFRSLEFGVRIMGQEPLRVISYRGPNQPNTAVDDPWQMYARIFANANLNAGQLAQLRAERQSVLDFLKDDIARLRARVSAQDKARLDAHLGGLRGIEQELANVGSSCQAPTLPAKSDPHVMEAYPVIGRLQTDLMLLALTCGMTRVATFMWANADSWQFYPWIGVNEEHHELSHSGETDTVNSAKLIKINAWHSEQVAYVLDRLAAVPETGGGTMLDSTVLLWGNELGAGNTHTYQNIPWVLAGGAGGYFRMGRSLRYVNQPHNNLLVSICHAMGLTDVTTFGYPELCTGPLAGLAA
jgi:hypothetical protein